MGRHGSSSKQWTMNFALLHAALCRCKGLRKTGRHECCTARQTGKSRTASGQMPHELRGCVWSGPGRACPSARRAAGVALHRQHARCSPQPGWPAGWRARPVLHPAPLHAWLQPAESALGQVSADREGLLRGLSSVVQLSHVSQLACLQTMCAAGWTRAYDVPSGRQAARHRWP